jgi:hypothetical protein
MNLSQILDLLDDPDGDLQWDESWDLLMSHEEYSDEDLHRLLEKLNGRTSIVRMGVIRKLTYSRVPFEKWAAKLQPLLADESRIVRIEALDAVATHASEVTPELLQGLRTMARRFSEHVDLRIRAWLYFRRLRKNVQCRDSNAESVPE